MVYTDDMVYTVDTVDEGGHYGKDRAEASLWKVTDAGGCPGVF